MNGLRNWLAWGLARIGWPGQVGLAFLAAAALVCLAVVAPLDARVARDQAQLERLARQPATPVAAPRDWRASLPRGHAGHAHLSRLFRVAAENGLRLREGRYRESREAGAAQGGGLLRLAIVLPVNGRYPALRAFLAQALSAEPGLALEGLRLSREDMATGEVEAELRLVLLVGNAS